MLRLALHGLRVLLVFPRCSCDFLRIHRSTIVNVHLIKEIQPWFHGYHLVLLQNGQELRMSRYQSEIAKRLGLV